MVEDSPYTDDELLPLSALQHYAFCPRQCALIHVDRVWEENRLTAEGRILHDHVDQAGSETRGSVVRATAVRLVSRSLGLFGVADMLEFHRVDSAANADGNTVAVSIPGHSGFWSPFFVEYKRGKPKPNRADEVQLCAQALCLEEMRNIKIGSGALFYGETRRRCDVTFDAELRVLTKCVADSIHQMVKKGAIPPATESSSCSSCSLVSLCRPQWSRRPSARTWLERQIEDGSR